MSIEKAKENIKSIMDNVEGIILAPVRLRRVSIISKLNQILNELEEKKLEEDSCPSWMGVKNGCAEADDVEKLEAKNKRLKELIERHRICITCGKQLSPAEAKSVHTCYDERLK